MKFCTFIILSAIATAQCSELFLSEYIEGSSYNKALEIYNPAESAIDLDQIYDIQFYFNGNSSPNTTIPLEGSISPQQTFVLVCGNAEASLLNIANQIAGGTWFNGDDAIALRKNGVMIDILGQIGFDPGSEWGSGIISTADNTLRRKMGVCNGDVVADDIFDPALEWDGFITDTFDGLGAHDVECATGNSLSIYEIQYTDNSNGDSPLLDQGNIVTTGIVTAVYSTCYVIQESPGGAWRGLWVEDGVNHPVIGDRIQLNGTVREIDFRTTMTDLTGFRILSSANSLPSPSTATTETAADEKWEGVVLQVKQVTVTNPDLGEGEWSINDGSGDLHVDDKGSYSYLPKADDYLQVVMGPIDYFNCFFKIQPRYDRDIQASGELVVINEIHADPDPDEGDANQDGLIHTSQDEFIELYNLSNSEIDLSGWQLSDADKVRHIFPAGSTIPMAGCMIIFGGGDPKGDFGGAVVQTASSGTLSLNNSGDTVRLDDNNGKSIQVTYGIEGNDNQSLTRDPDGDGSSFVKHTLAHHAHGSRFSPGKRIDGSSFFSTYIHIIQGNVDVSTMAGQPGVGVEGIVVGDFQTANRLDGFFVEEEFNQQDEDPLTSEGIFIHDEKFGVDVQVGDLVRVIGTVSELEGKTQINLLSSVVLIGTSPLPEPTAVMLPFSSPAAWEAFEGMNITLLQELTVTGVYDLFRYGEVDLSSNERLYAPTQQVSPGIEANNVQFQNVCRHIRLDDGCLTTPTTPPFLSWSNTLRLGSTLSSLTGILDYNHGRYKIQTIAPVDFVEANPRREEPVPENEIVRAAFLNLNNFFNGDGHGGGFPTQRGAGSLLEYQRQREKLVNTLVGLQAQVIGVAELENDGFDLLSAVQDMVNGLNTATEPHTFAFVNPGMERIGEDQITNGILYQPSALDLVGSAAILDHSVDSRFDPGTRPCIAQTFQDHESNRFTFVVGHFRSKGGECAGDADMGDGQGACNQARTLAAEALVDWLAHDPTDSGDNDVLIMGDLNAYALEDPLLIFKNTGYVEEIERFCGAQAYSYVFDAQSGTLDHALTSSTMSAQVVGSTIWHINADEPPELDYHESNPIEFYDSGPFRSSDHDPLLLSLHLEDPINIELSLFQAVYQDNVVNITWQTLAEPELAGFFVYRSISREAEFQKITGSLVPNTGDSARGGEYHLSDPGGAMHSLYQLQMICRDGKSGYVGPFSVQPSTKAVEN
ncbi:MAG: ExeM/NucH family extracellular endonuclease, partial [Calditrichaeota bacterium]